MTCSVFGGTLNPTLLIYGITVGLDTAVMKENKAIIPSALCLCLPFSIAENDVMCCRGG